MNGIQYAPLINGAVHSWANLVVAIAGVPITGISKISYSDDQTIENIYGAGLKPIGRGYGKIEYSGNITLLRSEIEAIRASSDTGRLQDIAPFEIIVQYIPVNGQKIVIHILKDVQFKKDGNEQSEGDTSNYTDLELVIGDIIKE